MAGDRDRDLLEALAEALAQGGELPQETVGHDEEQSRVAANLRRLAALRDAFARTGRGESGDGDSPSPPARWGHLEVRARLGAGAFGEVYRAWDPILRREVALKLLREGSDAAAEPLAEAQRLARVRHPHVLAVHGVDVHHGRVGLWADLLAGETLEQRLLRDGPLPRDQVLALARQLAGALSAIHEAGLVHGDIKAGNVMLEDDRAVLMDFGAGVASGELPRYGSPLSTAPELLAGARASPAADLYALGALLHRLATGQHPQASPGMDEARLRRALGAPAAALVASLLAAEPSRRPDAVVLLQRLDALARLPAQRRRRVAVVAVVVALLAALGISLYALERTRAERDRADRIKDLVVGGLQQTSPTKARGPASVIEVVDHLVSSLDTELEGLPLAQAEMRVVLGATLAGFEDRERGLPLLERGVAELRRTPGATRGDLMHSLLTLGVQYSQAGRTIESMAAAREVESLLEELPATDEYRMAAARAASLAANAFGAEGRPLSAMDASRRALAMRQDVVGDGNPQLAVEYNNIGLAALHAGLGEQAVAAYAEAARLLELGGRERSAPMAFVQFGLVSAWLLHDPAAPAFDTHLERARQLYASNFPDGHPALWMLEEREARRALLTGRHEQAESGYRRLLDSPDLPATLGRTVGFYFGASLLARKNPEAAADAFRIALEASAPAHASERPMLAAAGVGLAVSQALRDGSVEADTIAHARRTLAQLEASEFAQRPELELLARWLEQLRQAGVA